jgi:hypothetical protein
VFRPRQLCDESRVVKFFLLSCDHVDESQVVFKQILATGNFYQ